MPTTIKLPLYIAMIVCLEAGVYVWSRYTASLPEGSFFYIEARFIFDKCARISGRISSILHITMLWILGSLGLKQLYAVHIQWEFFLVLSTLFAVNHVMHFYYLVQNFKQRALVLKVSENRHGCITTICILLFPFVLVFFTHLNTLLYIVIVIHVLNVSYAIMDIFNNKVKQGTNAYHNQLGILITASGCVYVLYRMYCTYSM